MRQPLIRMSLWATKRQATYLGIVLLIMFTAIALPVYFYIIKKPATCFDGIQNQNEEGIDCGGVCAKVCSNASQAPLVHWQQFFKVAKGVYSAVAQVENPNINVYAKSVPYRFRMFDENNVMIAERDGTAFMLPNTIFPIFESAIQTGERVPVRMTFEFLNQTPNWQKKAYQLPQLVIIDQTLASSTAITSSSSPRVDATIQNQTDFTVSNIEVVAVIYDTNNNAIAASHTIVDQMLARSKANVVFTWPTAFGVTVSKIELTPKVLPRFTE